MSASMPSSASKRREPGARGRGGGIGQRLCDLAVLALLAPIAVPVVAVVALAVLIMLGRPVFFVQVRPGLHGEPFALVKFRTMHDGRDEHGLVLPDEQRLTRFGRWLRATSLDELPELWNVLCGEMALVGPRPLLLEYLPLYSPEQARRHEVRPGITGWAQINGRNALSWEDKFALDVWYVEHRSLRLDLEILLATLLKVLKREGISAADHATMPPFAGNGDAASARRVEVGRRGADPRGVVAAPTHARGRRR